MAAWIYLVTIDPRSTVALTQTCQALEVPALSAVWEIQSPIKLPILSVLLAVACCYTSYAHMCVCSSIILPLLYRTYTIQYFASSVARGAVDATINRTQSLI